MTITLFKLFILSMIIKKDVRMYIFLFSVDKLGHHWAVCYKNWYTHVKTNRIGLCTFHLLIAFRASGRLKVSHLTVFEGILV